METLLVPIWPTAPRVPTAVQVKSAVIRLAAPEMFASALHSVVAREPVLQGSFVGHGKIRLLQTLECGSRNS
jgi:hypothetical protein